jgi:uncharacterized protein HemX
MRIPRPRLRRRRAQGAAEPAKPAPPPPAQAAAPTPARQPAAPQERAATRPGSTPAAGAAAPRPDPHERIDSLRAWVAMLDRKLGVRTYLLGALALLAAAAAAAALVLVILLKQDAATDDDVNAIRDQLSGVQQSATAAAQQSVQSVDQRLTDLEGEVSRLSADERTTKRELQVVQDDIKELRSQQSSGARPGGAVGTP